jgi:hypothetical protein
VGSCKHDNKLSVSMEGRKFLNSLSVLLASQRRLCFMDLVMPAFAWGNDKYNEETAAWTTGFWTEILLGASQTWSKNAIHPFNRHIRSSQATEQVGSAVTLPKLIRQVPSSNIGQTPIILTDDFHGFPLSVQVNSGISAWNGPPQITPHTFQVHQTLWSTRNSKCSWYSVLK